ncbi:hypothetical protein M0813_00848 [Anaeramoeba flamelloides]|uniref:Uncharacterized protein n=1 Tax=Anaeramoeba flamelloides TaxID=1746091 RepID=A0ABQ8XG70_9EUKA|nr:hypothetical protein M0813_00848 [Anaeramoeba flamelloides]
MSQTRSVSMSFSSYENLENRLTQLRDNLKKKQSSLKLDEIFIIGKLSLSNNNSFLSNNNNDQSFFISQTQKGIEDGGQIVNDTKEMEDSIELNFDSFNDRSNGSVDENDQFFEESDFDAFATTSNNSLEIQFEDVDEDVDGGDFDEDNSILQFDSSLDLCPTLVETNNFQQEQDQKKWINEQEHSQLVDFETKENNQQLPSVENDSQFFLLNFENNFNLEYYNQNDYQEQIQDQEQGQVQEKEQYPYQEKEQYPYQDLEFNLDQEQIPEQQQDQEQYNFLEFNETLPSSPQTNTFELMNQGLENFFYFEQPETFGCNNSEMN